MTNPKVGDLVRTNDQYSAVIRNASHSLINKIGEITKVNVRINASGDEIVLVWWPQLNSDQYFTVRFLDKL